jgi:hypothetical protein
MTEPALTPEQSHVLRFLFARIIKRTCYCNPQIERTCVRCRDLVLIEESFPGTFRQACVDAAKGTHE